MSGLTPRQRKQLRALAHDLEPIVQVGKELVTEPLVRQLDQALQAHELVKVRFLEGKREKTELLSELVSRTGAVVAGVVGHVAILYRPHPDEAKRKIRLEERSSRR